jgi:hypothetical protein
MRIPLLFLLVGTSFAQAAGTDVVFVGKNPSASLVELFSSEGCSSCPPAEAKLSQLKTAPGLWTDLFPVAFHVDYWDSLGWPDRFASKAYTLRQHDYAARLGTDVYTPEFLVNGLEWKHWWLEGGKFPSDAAQKSGVLTLAVDSGSKMTATYLPDQPAATHPLSVNVALLGFNRKSNVTRGENAGKELTHDFVVLDFSSLPMTTGRNGKFQSASMTLHSSSGDPGAIVAWVSRNDGAILQIAGGWLTAQHGSN